MSDLTRVPLLNVAGFPRELLALRRWVMFDCTKRPLMPDGTAAKSTDPATWSSAGDVLNAVDRWRDPIIGPGIVLGDLGDGRTLAGVDIDACRDLETGALDDLAAAILAAMQSYAEASVSGTGIHVLFFGTIPPGRSKKSRVEMYDHDRYFTMSGVRIGRYGLEPRTREAAIVHAVHLAEPPAVPRPESVAFDPTLRMSDLELIAKATAARNGAKVAALLAGECHGYGSPSEADAALAACLGYWTRDEAQIERILRNSALYRQDKERRNRGYYARTARKYSSRT